MLVIITMQDNSLNAKIAILTDVALPETPDNNTLRRCPLRFFLLGLAPFIVFCVIGLLAVALVWGSGLNSTRLDNYFGFGLWTVFEFSLIAFGAGAFFTGLLRYSLDIEPVKEIFNLALVIAFICCTGAIFIAVLQTGQPLRVWFLLWHANPQSMLTLASFSLVLYALILAVQYSELLLKHRSPWNIPLFKHLWKNLRLFMPLFAALGAFVAIFHQGAPGGMFGVLGGRPFAFREGFFIWPWTFFLFILSVLGTGLMFTVMISSSMEKISRKQLLSPGIKNVLGRISGNMLCIYIIFKMLDTLWWAKGMAPQAGLSFEQMFHSPYYGLWLLILEIGLCGIVPVILLLCKSTRKKPVLFHLSGVLTCLGLCINRYTLVIQTQAQPVMPFDSWRLYIPNLLEWAVVGMIISYGVIVLSLSYRYLPVFAREKPLTTKK